MKFRFLVPLLIFAAFLCAAGPLDSAFQNYFAIQTSLANDSLKDAVEASKKLEVSLPQNGKDDRLEKIRSLARQISTAQALDQARKAFGELSVLMISLGKENKIQASEYYCPMVKKSWLQKSDRTENPYLGKSMAECGEKKK